jgi:hypothetical protein
MAHRVSKNSDLFYHCSVLVGHSAKFMLRKYRLGDKVLSKAETSGFGDAFFSGILVQ